MRKGAEIRNNHRYKLWRIWDEQSPLLGWVMLNPSTADASVDDATIRKCMGFARRWDFGGIIVANLFSWRATNPAELYSVDADRLNGSSSDQRLLELARDCGQVVVGWGAHGARWPRRVREVSDLLHFQRNGAQISHLGLTKAGEPKHPLYIPYVQAPEAWAAAGAPDTGGVKLR